MNRVPNPNYDKVAVVFGATGQIGSYLCEYLLSLGYSKVVGVTRRVSNVNTCRLISCLNNINFTLFQADVTDPFSLNNLYSTFISDQNLRYEIYNLAAASHVHTSFHQPKLYADITGIGHLNVLESSKRYHELGYKVRTYFMSSSETFGLEKNIDGFQNLETKFKPRSPYAAAKLYAFNLNQVYRESYGMWNCAGIIFNTESPRRGEDFVTRKITKWFADFAVNNYVFNNKLQLGNIQSCRDWTHAKDTVKAIHLIMDAQRPKDYVVASGETHSVYNFMEHCYNYMESVVGNQCDLPLDSLYEINPSFLRPNEVPYLKGRADHIRLELGWRPSYTFSELVHEMFNHDYKHLKLMNSINEVSDMVLN